MKQRIRVFLLGPPRVLAGDRPIRLRRRKAMALLAYLAVSRRSMSREALATLLWPDAPAGRSYGNLRNLIWILCRSGLDGCLEVAHDEVGLSSSRVEVDVVEFRRLVGETRRGLHNGKVDSLIEAADLYADHFMAGFGLRDNVSFDEWQMQQAEMLRVAVDETMEGIVRHFESRRQLDRAVAYASRWLALSPLSEPVQRRLMGLYAESGRRAEALDVYDRSARLLANELGLAPAPETAALREKVLAGQDPAAARTRGRTAPRRRSGPVLGASAAPFVGRRWELACVREFLCDPASRLLTVVGHGGSGKTRLAMEALQGHASFFPDGMFVVPLASVASREFVIPAIMDALDMPLSHGGADVRVDDRGPQTAGESFLVRYLREKRTLLLLDNLEHLLPGPPGLADILREAPGVKVLATSRQRLRLPGETVLELDGLPCPKEGAGREEWERSPATELFLRSAVRSHPTFAAREADREDIGRTCRRLGGNPLGIELASRWVRVLSCRDIAREIESGLDFLTSREPDLPERHRSLRAVFDHSWALLSPDERAACRRLSVLRGPSAPETAASVSGSAPETISSLAEKSLLGETSGRTCEMHEMFRQYAAEKLREDPEEYGQTMDRLTDSYLGKLVRREAGLKGPDVVEVLEDLAQDAQNIRNAWLWAARRRRVEPMRAAFLALFLFYDIRSRFQEGGDLFHELRGILDGDGGPSDGPGDAARRLSGLFLAAEGWFLRFSSPTMSALHLRGAVECLEPYGPAVDLAFARILYRFAAVRMADERERQDLRECVRLYEAAGDPWGTGTALEAVAFASVHWDLGEAHRAARRSLEVRRRIRDRWGEALALYALGRVAERRGLPRAARKRFEESLAIRLQLGLDVDGRIDCLNDVGILARRTGRYAEARQRFEDGLRLAREIGNAWRAASALVHLALVDYYAGEYGAALARLTEARPALASLGMREWGGIAGALFGVVNLAAGNERAAREELEGPDPDPGPMPESATLDCCTLGAPRTPGGLWRSLGRGRLALRAGDRAGAREYLLDALHLSTVHREDPATLEILADLAEISVGAGDTRRPARAASGLRAGRPARPETGATGSARAGSKASHSSGSEPRTSARKRRPTG